MRARDEVALTIATALVFTLGVGGLHSKRVARIREAVFGGGAYAQLYPRWPAEKDRQARSLHPAGRQSLAHDREADFVIIPGAKAFAD